MIKYRTKGKDIWCICDKNVYMLSSLYNLCNFITSHYICIFLNMRDYLSDHPYISYVAFKSARARGQDDLRADLKAKS